MHFFKTGLPPSGSWQDLKDHMREAGDVCFADAFKDGSGVVEFLRYEDMKYAIKKLDDSRFRSHEVSGSQSSYCEIISFRFHHTLYGRWIFTFLNTTCYWESVIPVLS